MQDRREFGRKLFEVHGYNVYLNGQWLAIPQKVIRTVLLERSEKGLWVPEYPTEEPLQIGDNVGLEILEAARLYGQPASV